MQQLQEERLFLAVSVIAVLEKCIKATIEYCKDRPAFGKSIIENQHIHFRLAELQTEVEALRALSYQACELFMTGEDMTYLCLLYTSPSPRDATLSRMPSSA